MYENFKRVLVTTDFSTAGDGAIGHAFRVGADHGAEVVLCHVIETPPTPNPLYAHYSPSGLFQPEQRRLAEEQAQKALLERVPKKPPLSEVKHRTHVTHGEPIAEILRLAEQEQGRLAGHRHPRPHGPEALLPRQRGRASDPPRALSGAGRPLIAARSAREQQGEVSGDQQEPGGEVKLDVPRHHRHQRVRIVVAGA